MSPPKIGGRIVKSALAVAVCMVISALRPGGIPFYAAIAAVLCMQPTLQDAFKTGFNRVIGTLVGGALGILALAALRGCLGADTANLWVQAAVAALGTLLVLYILSAMGKATACYIGCVVFLCITVSHGGEASPYWFAVNRMLDTIIGIGVSMLINLLPIGRRQDRETDA